MIYVAAFESNIQRLARLDSIQLINMVLVHFEIPWPLFLILVVTVLAALAGFIAEIWNQFTMPIAPHSCRQVTWTQADWKQHRLWAEQDWRHD